jgi:hypothetical protein
LIHFPILPEPPQPKEAIRMNVRYRVDLDQPERDELTAMLRSGKHPARKLKRAQILLAADAGLGDEAIAATVVVGGSTVYRTILAIRPELEGESSWAEIRNAAWRRFRRPAPRSPMQKTEAEVAAAQLRWTRYHKRL